MTIITYLTNNIFKQPSIFMGLIALVGLILQRKSFGDTIKGTFKTIIGVIILFIGVNLIGTAAAPLSAGFATLYKLPEANQFNPDTAWELLGTYGSTIGLVILIAFGVNLLVARFTPIKNIFLTGHIFFWMSYILVMAGVQSGLDGASLVVFASIFLSFYIIVIPWITRPFIRKITGSNDFTIGHTASIYIILGGLIGKVIGNKEKSTEDIKIPKSLDFFRDVTIATSLIMFVIYIIVGIVIGDAGRIAAFEPLLGTINTIPGMQFDLFSFSLMAGLTFGAGLTILLTGVRLMLSELIPAFKGISDKLIPNAIPALDVPMIFPYAPNALLVGFILSMVSSVATILILNSTGSLMYAVIPLVTSCFYDIAPGALAANAEGGRTAAIVTSLLGGVLLVFLISFSLQLMFDTSAAFLQLYGGNDNSIWAIISGLIGKIFG